MITGQANPGGMPGQAKLLDEIFQLHSKKTFDYSGLDFDFSAVEKPPFR